MDDNLVTIPRFCLVAFWLVQAYVIWRIIKYKKKTGGMKEIYNGALKGTSVRGLFLSCIKVVAIFLGAVGFALLSVTLLLGLNEYSFAGVAFLVLSIALFAVAQALA